MGHRLRPRWLALVVGSVVVAALAGGVWFATSTDDPSPRARIALDAARVAPAGAGSGVELLDPGPLEPRADVPMVWTGEELVVWGGDIEARNMGLPGEDRAFADGAAYDPVSRQWRKMATGPLPANMDGVSSVTTKEGVVIARGARVALWQPTTDTWRELDDAPGMTETPGAVPDLVSTGTEVLSVRANAALDVGTGHWAPLPEPPLKLESAVSAWTGSELVVVGEQLLTVPGGMTFDPASRTWRELEVPKRLSGNAIALDWDGERVIAVDYEMHAAAYTPGSRTWDELPSLPARFSEHYPSVVTVPPATLAVTAYAYAIRSGNGSWMPIPSDVLPIPRGGGPVVTPAGTAREHPALFVFGMTADRESGFVVVDPEQVAATARTLQVGVVTVDLPAGVSLARSDYDDTIGHEQVLVELRTPTGPCTMTSQYGRMAEERPFSAASSDGRVSTAQPTSSDLVRITCTDRTTVEQIARATRPPRPPAGRG